MKLEGAELLKLSVPRGTDADPEHFFSSLHGLLHPLPRRIAEGQSWIGIEAHGSGQRITFYLWAPRGQRGFLTDILSAGYRGIELEPAEDPLQNLRGHTAFGLVTLQHPHLPIRTDFNGADPKASLIHTLGRPGDEEFIHVQLLVRPRASGWQRPARSEALRLKRGHLPFLRGLANVALGGRPSVKPMPHQLDEAKAIEDKTSELGFECVLRVVAAATSEGQAREFLRSISASLRPWNAQNSFRMNRVLREQRFLDALRNREFVDRSFTLNARELAAFAHLPVDGPWQLSTVASPKLVPPRDLPRDGNAVFTTNYVGREQPAGQHPTDRMRHRLFLGPTGSGKTVSIVESVLQDIENDDGVALLDPKGDAIRGVLERFPRLDRIDDVILITPADGDSVITVNPLEWKDAEDRDLLVEELNTTYSRRFRASWGNRTDYIFRGCLLTITATPHGSIAQIPYLLSNKRFRDKVVSKVADKLSVEGFWAWYDSLNAYQKNEAISPLMNKLSEHVMREKIRRVTCSPKSSIDFDDIVNNGRILLADLSVGGWGETPSAVLGSFLFGRAFNSVRRRAAIPEAERRPFYMYVDEFASYVGILSDFEAVLSTSRSYGMGLTLAHQGRYQLPADLASATTQNIATKLCWQLGVDDARYYAKEFGLEPEVFQNLPRFHAIARYSINGATSGPFTVTANPPSPVVDLEMPAKIAKASRERYGRPVWEVDRELEEMLRLEPNSDQEPRRRSGRRVST